MGALRFTLHLLAVYLIVQFPAFALAGWIYGIVIPAIQAHTQSSSLEFLYNHLFIFSSLPAFASGLLNARFKHKIAQWVWVMPTAMLAYKLIAFPIKASVLEAQSWPALHYFFGGGFLIPEFHSLNDLFRIMAWNPEMRRALEQLGFTAPFYGGIAYSLAATLGLHSAFFREPLERLRQSEARSLKLHVADAIAAEPATLNELPPGPPHAPVQ